MLVIAKVLLLLPQEKAGRSSLLKLGSANSDNQILTVLRSGQETRVIQMYSKKAKDNANNTTEASEKPKIC